VSDLFNGLMQQSSGGADADLPSVMTCANYLKLPPYSTKVRFHTIKRLRIYLIIFSSMSFCCFVSQFARSYTAKLMGFVQERLKEKLLYAITEGQGSFHLS